ncbi:hypothetical protein [Nocardia beijingensis]|uniref:Uncharacterized protein n=1 Tax=Nocardia beijingensis TaxID=95162 RepID=A0ABW7WG60_9NOCA
MTTPDPQNHQMYVYADSVLAEFLCQAHLMELTPERAERLRIIHRWHHPDECTVHLEAAYWLLVEAE